MRRSVLRTESIAETSSVVVSTRSAKDETFETSDWHSFAAGCDWPAMYCSPAMVSAIGQGLGHDHFIIQAKEDNQIVGILPLVLVKSRLFGRFLVSLPYVNWAGVLATNPNAARVIIDEAIRIADHHDVRYLELRNGLEIDHPALTHSIDRKVQMRLPLATSIDDVWGGLKSEVRTQIRKAKKKGLETDWGGVELLDEFYDVFAQNMRDLGTPVFPMQLFRNMLDVSSRNCEICVVRSSGKPIAACIAVHSHGMTEIPSAGSLRAYRSTAANSLMYWEAIERAVSLGQSMFDFGRSSVESSTFKFKKKWGAVPHPTVWQYYLRKGTIDDMRPENSKFQIAIAAWKRLPVRLTRLIGPPIIRGIP